MDPIFSGHESGHKDAALYRGGVGLGGVCGGQHGTNKG